MGLDDDPRLQAGLSALAHARKHFSVMSEDPGRILAERSKAAAIERGLTDMLRDMHRFHGIEPDRPAAAVNPEP